MNLAAEKIPRSIVNSDDLPKDWRVVPNRALFEERNIRGCESEDLLSVSLNYGVLRQSDIPDRKDTSSADKGNYKLVEPGDLAYNKMRMWQGAVGMSKYRGIVSPAYVILNPRVELVQQYYVYLFKTQFYINEFNRFSYGLCDDMNSLRYDDFKRIYSVYPPIEIQHLIVEAIDEFTSKLDVCIAMLGLIIPSSSQKYVENVVNTVLNLIKSMELINLLSGAVAHQTNRFMGKSGHDNGLISATGLAKDALVLKSLFVEFRNAYIHHAVLGNIALEERAQLIQGQKP